MPAPLDSWPPKLRMLAVLGATRALLATSERDGWPDEDPKSCAATFDEMMAHLLASERVACPPFASIQFAPTGPVQEIAMANGWHDAYLLLADAFDDLQRELRTFHP